MAKRKRLSADAKLTRRDTEPHPGDASGVIKPILLVGGAVSAAILYGITQNSPCRIANGHDIKEWILIGTVGGGLIAALVQLFVMYSNRHKYQILFLTAFSYFVMISASAYASLRGCACFGSKPWFYDWFGGFVSWCLYNLPG